MHTSNNYYQFQAQSKMCQLQHQADIHRQLKQNKKPINMPISLNQVRQLFLTLRSTLARPVYVLKAELNALVQ